MNKVDNFIEIVLLGIVKFLVASEDRDIALTVTNGNPSSIWRPPQAIQRAVTLRYLLAGNRNFCVRIDVPNIDETFSVAGCKHTWVSWTPSGVIHILLCALKRKQGLLARVGRPEFDCPVHGTWEEQFSHLSVLLTLADTWMNVDWCDWRIVMFVCPLHGTSLPLIALINVKVFWSNIEVLLLALSEIKAMSIDLLSITTASDLGLRLLGCLARIGRLLRHAKEVEGLGIDEHSRSPIAHFTIITNTHNRVLIVVANDWETVNWVLMAILSETTLLNRLRSILALSSPTTTYRLFLGSNIPFKKVSRHGRTDNNVWVVWIEHGFSNLILAGQS